MSDTSKKDYIEKLEAKLDEWAVEIGRFKVKLEGAEEKIRDEYQKVVDDLHERSEHIKETLQKLEEESGETWEEIRYSADDAWQEMREALKKAADTFKDIMS